VFANTLALRSLRVGRRSGDDQGHVWALDDVSFEMRRGEVLGLIGANGAGKSTLLKILARITEPTDGQVLLSGRVGSLLEVGTGFHPELTGRENVYFNGAILGMRRPEIARKFDEIVAFSGVERHIDTPVKWYSSGMFVRLGFAVAAHLEPDILVVDEVLAVGDAEFQRKCLGRMNDVAREGRTVLFVSHNMQAIRRLCERAIMLDRGKLIMDGDVATVAAHYLGSVSVPDEGLRSWAPADRPGNETARIVEVRATAGGGEPASTFFSSGPVNLEVELDVASLDPNLIVAFDLLTADGVMLFTSYHRDPVEERQPAFVQGRNAFRCTIPPGLLNTGRYLVNLRVSIHNRRWVAFEESVLQFDVIADHGESLFLNAQARSGVIMPVLDWTAVEPTSSEGYELPAARISAPR
jgi:lipopolysaccharide transport system ATP-binding protein